MNTYDQIRVIASAKGVRVLDRAGKPLLGIVGVNIALRSGQPPLMQLNMAAGALDLAEGAPAFIVQDPATGRPKQVATIVFADGTTFQAPMPPPKEAAAPEAPAEEPPPPLPELPDLPGEEQAPPEQAAPAAAEPQAERPQGNGLDPDPLPPAGGSDGPMA